MVNETKNRQGPITKGLTGILKDAKTWEKKTLPTFTFDSLEFIFGLAWE